MQSHNSLARIYGVEYRLNGASPLSGRESDKVPCAVCHVSTRAAVLMIPARRQCPGQWTLEYSGYLMTERNSHNTGTYECVDRDSVPAPGFPNDTNGGFYHVEADCTGLPCPPYNAEDPLTCAVCTQ